jgi:hypothetical protein
MTHAGTIIEIADRDERSGHPSADGDAGAMLRFARQLRRELRDERNARVVIEDNAVTVLRVTPHGPDVTVIFSNGRCTLAIGSWHDDLVSLDTVMEYVKLAVTGGLRVRIDQLSGKPWKYALERRLDDGAWQEESVLMIPRLAFWNRRQTTTYLQNGLGA